MAEVGRAARRRAGTARAHSALPGGVCRRQGRASRADRGCEISAGRRTASACWAASARWSRVSRARSAHPPATAACGAYQAADHAAVRDDQLDVHLDGPEGPSTTSDGADRRRPVPGRLDGGEDLASQFAMSHAIDRSSIDEYTATCRALSVAAGSVSEAGEALRSAVNGRPVAATHAKSLDFGEAVAYARGPASPACWRSIFSSAPRACKALAKYLGERKEELYAVSAHTGATRADSWIDIEGGIGTLYAYASIGSRELPSGNLLHEGPAMPLGKQGGFAGTHVLVPRRGLAVHINAFNFPVWGLLEKFAPSFLAGMPCLVKPASSTSLSGRGAGTADRARAACSLPEACSSSSAASAICSIGWMAAMSSHSPVRRRPPEAAPPSEPDHAQHPVQCRGRFAQLRDARARCHARR